MLMTFNATSPKDALCHLQWLSREDYIFSFDEASIKKVVGARNIRSAVHNASFISVLLRDFHKLYPHALATQEKDRLADTMPVFGDVFTVDVELSDMQLYDILDL